MRDDTTMREERLRCIVQQTCEQEDIHGVAHAISPGRDHRR